MILIAELIETGLLILVDLPGKVPHYLLDPDFEWAGRFKFFPRAMQAWLKQKAAPVPVPKEIEEEEIDEEDDRALADYSIIKVPSREGDEIEAIPDIIQRTPTKSVDTERQHKIDMILACTLKKLAAGEFLRFRGKSGAVAKISEETGVGSNLVMLVLNGQANEAPKVTIIHREGSEMRRVLINPSLSWKSIKGFPLTMEVCRQILGE